jgi:hypothetical protein
VEDKGGLENGFEVIDSRVPYDYYFLHPSLLDILRQAYDLTRSKTATIRLLSTDGRDLIRFCGYPERVMKEPHSAIAISRKDSVNAFVARSGKICELKKLNHRASYRAFDGLLGTLAARRDIRSEYCMPIVVRGRLIGTVNLESEYPDAYSGEKHYLSAVRARIELALYSAQSYYEQSVLSASARGTLNTHEILKCADELGKLAHEVPPAVIDEILMLQSRIRSCVAPTEGGMPERNGRTEFQSYQALIESLAIAKNIDHVIEWREVDKSIDASLNPTTEKILSLVLSEILDNSFLQATQVPGGHIRLSITGARLGGRKFDVIRVTHNVSSSLDRSTVAQLYRVPIQKADRPHIGAFLAGAMIRSLGGEINFSFDPKYVSANTTIQVPDLTLERTGGGSHGLI